MNASNIERIELIHTPPANFDAEGNAGIINIVLKKTADDGLNGGYSLNAGYGKREKYGAGLNFNYRKKIVNLFGSYDYRFNHNPQVFTNDRILRAANGDILETDGFSDRSPDLTTQNGRLGADFQITPKTVIGVLGTYFDRNWDMDAVNHIDYSTNNVLDHRVQMFTKEINRWNSWTSNLNFNHQFTKEKTLSMDLDYVYYKIHNPSSYTIQDLNPEGALNQETQKRVGKETPIKIAVAKADYNQNFGKNVQFETGIKGSMSRFDNDVRVEDRLQETWTVDPTLTSRFQLKEDIAAAYTSFSIKANSKTDLKLGLRYEYTSTNLGSVEQPNVVDRKYGIWFPSAFVSRKITEEQSINLSYSRRIYRPGFTQLAPYLIFYDPTTIEGGNPALQPVFADAIRSSYRYKSWQLTVEYNYQNPSIYYLPIVDAVNNTQFNQPVNNGRTHTAYADLNFPLHPCKWWEMQNDIFVAWQRNNVRYAEAELNTTGRFSGLNSTQTFSLPKDFSIEVSGNFITPGFDGISRWKANGQLNFGLQKKLSEQWGSLNFSVNDIFASSNWITTIDQPQVNLHITGGYKQAERVFMLTWTNKFGNKKLRDARQRQSGAADEMRR
ncbi:MAG: TonB-dependent receptor, partial [Saprospiraceae bacterium]